MESLFLLFLDAAVALRVLEYKDRGGPTAEDFKSLQKYSQLLGERGNFLWMKSKKKGEAAQTANAVADIIAALSFLPGGITSFGRHWESKKETKKCQKA